MTQTVEAIKPAVDTPLTATHGQRLDFIDLMRGLVICLMVLDHVRDFFHKDAFLFDPLDPDKTSIVLFFTRWITHLCAATFVCLAGTSIFLQESKGKTGWALSRFLLTRGLWLIVLELTLVNFGFDFAVGIFLQVIWAIGMSMILMAAAIWLPRHGVLILGILVVAGHNAFDGIAADTLGAFGPPWNLFMQAGPIPGGYDAYPALPWFGIMCLGYGLGPLFAAADKRIAWLGIGLIVLFLMLRLPNFYGNGSLWQVSADPGRAFMAILNVTKYPPSLHYVLITLGVSFLLMPALPRLPQIVKTPLLAFGRTPLLTYLLHIYVAHGLALLTGIALGVPGAHFSGTFSDPGRLIADHWGFPLWGVYLVWLAVLAILYPMSRAYAAYRAKHKHWWTSYL